MPGKKDDNQLNIFDHGMPQTSTRKIQDLGSAIEDGFKSSDIASAKQAAQEQEALLQKLIEEKKKRRPGTPDHA
ncbi:MAG: hypothetical protein V1913_08745 [Fibrobacterota bacterium]